MTPGPNNWHPRPPRRADWAIAAGLLAVTFAILWLTTNVGIPRDESFYFRAGTYYQKWFTELWANYQAGELWRSFTKANVDSHWWYNTEHPVLMKTLFGLSHLLFHEHLGWLRPTYAMRIPGILTGAAAVSLTYLFARGIFGRIAGLVAAGALFFQPRFFFHAHFACFDVPITFFWVATVYAYWRSLESNGWAVATGLIWGLALCTKLNAFFLPVVLTGHWLATNWTRFGVTRTRNGWSITWPPMPRALIAMAILGPIVFYTLTPRFWFDTFHRVSQYIQFHLKHVHYFVFYFGENLKNPPFPIHYPWVMTLLTVPAGILIAAGFGMVQAGLAWDPIDWARRWWRAAKRGETPPRTEGDPRGTGLLLAINLVFPIALISMPSTPIFGGTKHWMPAMPFLAIFAGAGATLAWRQLQPLFETWESSTVKRTASSVSAALIALSILGPAGYATGHNHPFGTSYYNEFIGSIRGAANHQMFRQFWGYSSRQALPWMNEHAEMDGRVWIHNTTGYAWWHYQHENLVREDLDPTGLVGSEYAMYHHQKAFVMRQTDLWREYGTQAPAHVLSKEGVPLLSIYRRPRIRPSEETPSK